MNPDDVTSYLQRLQASLLDFIAACNVAANRILKNHDGEQVFEPKDMTNLDNTRGRANRSLISSQYSLLLTVDLPEKGDYFPPVTPDNIRDQVARAKSLHKEIGPLFASFNRYSGARSQEHLLSKKMGMIKVHLISPRSIESFDSLVREIEVWNKTFSLFMRALGSTENPKIVRYEGGSLIASIVADAELYNAVATFAGQVLLVAASYLMHRQNLKVTLTKLEDDRRERELALSQARQQLSVSSDHLAEMDVRKAEAEARKAEAEARKAEAEARKAETEIKKIEAERTQKSDADRQLELEILRLERDLAFAAVAIQSSRDSLNGYDAAAKVACGTQVEKIATETANKFDSYRVEGLDLQLKKQGRRMFNSFAQGNTLQFVSGRDVKLPESNAGINEFNNFLNDNIRMFLNDGMGPLQLAGTNDKPTAEKQDPDTMVIVLHIHSGELVPLWNGVLLPGLRSEISVRDFPVIVQINDFEQDGVLYHVAASHYDGDTAEWYRAQDSVSYLFSAPTDTYLTIEIVATSESGQVTLKAKLHLKLRLRNSD